MFARLSYTWSLMGASWEVLRKDVRLLIFPLLSGICCIAVFISFLIPIISSGFRGMPEDATPGEKFGYYAVLFLFYFCNYFVMTFFNTAIVAGAIARMQGGRPTIGGCIGESVKRLHLIIGWALLQATVGLILRIIEERSQKLGRFIAGLIGMAWTLMTYLVVPVMVVDQKGPFAAVAESSRMLKKTWGTQIAGNFSFGTIFFLLMLPAIAGFVAGAMVLASSAVLGLALIIISILYILILSLVQSALQSIFQAAVYLYALDPALLSVPLSDGTRGFPVKLVAGAIVDRD